MKRNVPFFLSLLVVLTLLGLTNCDKDLLTKDLDIDVAGKLELSVSGADPLTGSWHTELDPKSNIDVRDNFSRIQDINVTRLTFEVEDYIGADSIMGSGTWKLYPSASPTDVLTIADVRDVAFQELWTSHAETELPLSDAAKTKLVALMKAGTKMTLVFEGAVTEHPVYTRFNVRLYSRIRVKA